MAVVPVLRRVYWVELFVACAIGAALDLASAIAAAGGRQADRWMASANHRLEKLPENFR